MAAEWHGIVMGVRYLEGDVFLVPLLNGSKALGLVARMPKKRTILFGYFFLKDIDRAPFLKPADAALVAIFSDLLLKNGEWPVVYHLYPWNRLDWPMPKFVRTKTKNFTILVKYDEETVEEIDEERVSRNADVARCPPDSLHGAGSVANKLSELARRDHIFG